MIVGRHDCQSIVGISVNVWDQKHDRWKETARKS